MKGRKILIPLLILLVVVGYFALRPQYVGYGEKGPSTDVTVTLITNSIGMQLRYVPPGTFFMGSPQEEADREADEAQQGVRVKRGYFMSTTEVTQGQWQAVMGTNPSHFTGNNRLPVENVTYNDCVLFCKTLSKREDKPYRLPTEVDWEYACRAGTTTPFHTGNTITTDQANFDGLRSSGGGDDRAQTLPVGSFAPNAWGFHDMHGNVWEWCQPWAGDYLLRRPGDRVLRGGSFMENSRSCRSAYRYWSAPEYHARFCGFRVVLDIDVDSSDEQVPQ